MAFEHMFNYVKVDHAHKTCLFFIYYTEASIFDTFCTVVKTITYILKTFTAVPTGKLTLDRVIHRPFV